MINPPAAPAAPAIVIGIIGSLFLSCFAGSLISSFGSSNLLLTVV